MKPGTVRTAPSLEAARAGRDAEHNVRAGLNVALDAVGRLLEPFAGHDPDAGLEPAAGYDEGYHTALIEVRGEIEAALAAI